MASQSLVTNEDQQLRKNADYIKVYFFRPRFNLPDLIYIETLNMLIKTQGKEAPMKKTRLDNPSAMMAAVLLALSSAVLAQSNLPFPKTPSASTAGITLQESEHHWRQQPNRLPDDAPNIIIILTDDTGFGNPSTFGGPINTPTLTRLANEGIMYNSFHTTATCSPTRASLLTGRNRHRVGYGQISEYAGRFDEG